MDLTPDVTRESAPHGLATLADRELQRVLEALQQREKEVEKLRTQLKEVGFSRTVLRHNILVLHCIAGLR